MTAAGSAAVGRFERQVTGGSGAATITGYSTIASIVRTTSFHSNFTGHLLPESFVNLSYRRSKERCYTSHMCSIDSDRKNSER